MTLPIEASVPLLQETLTHNRNLVLVASPGAGKTTRLPRLLLERDEPGAIWVLEPRRLAARWAARFVAQELGDSVGQRVGYRVRFDDATGPSTRLIYMTEGLLLRSMQSNPTLRGVGAVVFDEFHGRTLASDIGLAALRYLQTQTRPDLRLIAMSATLDAQPLANFLGDAPVVDVPGRQFPVTCEFAAARSSRPLEADVAQAAARVLKEGADGHVLVFLPGMSEIRRAQQACAGLARAHDLLVLPLHGSLTVEEQDRAVRPCKQRKLILSTNVAETSVTIDGVVAVIDSGLSRQAAHQAWSGLSSLRVQPISQAAATQRAGRAGRTGPGRCLRLFTANDFKARPAFELPEMLRADLSESALQLLRLNLPPLRALNLIDAPPQAAVSSAEKLLVQLGAATQAHVLTPLGQRIADLPLHPRLGALMCAAEALGAADVGAAAAAYLSEEEGRAGFNAATHHGPSDIEHALERGLQGTTETVRRQLLRFCARGKHGAAHPDALGLAVLRAFPDRVAKRLTMATTGEAELQLAGGGRAYLSPSSVVREAEFLVAVGAMEREQSGRPRMLVHTASAIAPDWLMELGDDAVRETEEATWNAAQERAEVATQLRYDNIVLTESRNTQAASPAASALLLKEALARGWQHFVDVDAAALWQARVQLVARSRPTLELPEHDVEAIKRTLATMCEGARSFAQLRDADALGHLQNELTPEQRDAVQRLTPSHITLRGGRKLQVHYERDKPPWVESVLQDFFGSAQGPAVVQGQVPLTLHLLAPNRRPVQVTSDLAGFWERHYPALKKALSRRYPRHAWPDAPQDATPPPPSQHGRRPR